MEKSKVIGAITFAPSPDGTTQETLKVGPFIMSDEGTKRLLDVLARKMTQPAQNEETPACGQQHRGTRNYDVYTLVGEDMEPLARGIKSYAFAYALALRWSQDLGQTVKMMRRVTVNAASGAVASECVEVVDARDTSEGVYLTQQIRAEITRIQNAKIAMREVADDVRCMIEDADDTINGLRALAEIHGIPARLTVQTARAAADHFDTLHWYTLITHTDTEMIGELLATEPA